MTVNSLMIGITSPGFPMASSHTCFINAHLRLRPRFTIFTDLFLELLLPSVFRSSAWRCFSAAVSPLTASCTKKKVCRNIYVSFPVFIPSSLLLLFSALGSLCAPWMVSKSCFLYLQQGRFAKMLSWFMVSYFLFLSYKVLNSGSFMFLGWKSSSLTHLTAAQNLVPTKIDNGMRAVRLSIR